MTDEHDPEIEEDLSSSAGMTPELAAWLASAPAPTMPPEVWSSIEAALAAEPPFTPVATASVVDLGERRERSRMARAWPLLAGAAGLVLLGVVVLPAIRGSNEPGPVADAPSNSSVVTMPADGGQPAVGETPDSDVARAMPRMMMDTGTDYTPGGMVSQVGTLLNSVGITSANAAEDMSTKPPAKVSEASGSTHFASSASSMADCLGRLGIASKAHTTLVVDRGTFNGSDAGVIVSARSASAGVLDVTVVGSKCSDSDVAAAQRFQYTVSR